MEVRLCGRQLQYDGFLGHRGCSEHGDAGVQADESIRQVLLKTAVLKGDVSTPIQHTLQTLRYKLFAKPAYTTTEERKPILNLAKAMQQRQWMKELRDEAAQLDLPVKFATHHPPGAR